MTKAIPLLSDDQRIVTAALSINHSLSIPTSPILLSKAEEAKAYLTGELASCETAALAVARAGKMIALVRARQSPRCLDISCIFDALALRSLTETEPENVMTLYRAMNGYYPEMARNDTADCVKQTMRSAQDRFDPPAAAKIGLFFLTEFKPDYGPGWRTRFRYNHYSAQVRQAVLNCIKKTSDPAESCVLLKQFYETGEVEQKNWLLRSDMIPLFSEKMHKIPDADEKLGHATWLYKTLSEQMNQTRCTKYFRPAVWEMWACTRSLTDRAKKESQLQKLVSVAGSKFHFSPYFGVTTTSLHAPCVLALVNAARHVGYNKKPKHPEGLQAKYWPLYGAAKCYYKVKTLLGSAPL